MPTRTVYHLLTSLSVHDLLVRHAVTASTRTIRLRTYDRLKRLRTVFVNLLAVIQKLLDAVHIAVVGDSDSRHTRPDTLVHQITDLRHTV